MRGCQRRDDRAANPPPDVAGLALVSPRLSFVGEGASRRAQTVPCETYVDGDGLCQRRAWLRCCWPSRLSDGTRKLARPGSRAVASRRPQLRVTRTPDIILTPVASERSPPPCSAGKLLEAIRVASPSKGGITGPVEAGDVSTVLGITQQTWRDKQAR